MALRLIIVNEVPALHFNYQGSFLMMRLLAAVTFFFPLAAPALGQEPLPKVPDGFKIELVAKAPEIEAPTALAVAANGDVYFAEDPMDMRGPSNQNADKIWLLKGGDPKKRILIADNMWAVMGLEVVRDKLYVVHYPYISVFTLDAEGKATRREDLFTDVGPKSAPPGGFNDHVPSGIRMGMDGWLYVSIGDKGIPKMTRHKKDPLTDGIEVAEGRRRITPNGRFISLEGGGVIRFRPDGSLLEVFASGTRNHLDVPMDEHDRIFVRDNTDDGDGWNTRFMYTVKDGFYGYPWAFTRHPKEVLPMIHDFGPGAPCQGWVYCDDGLPEKYRGRIFHCEWGRGKIFAVKVQPDGAGFQYVDEIAFVDPTGTAVKDFRPYSLRPTADGRGFYITDWNFSGWQQPKVAGRIYKVTYVKDDVQPAPRGQDSDSIEELIKSLDHPAHTERLRAQRALQARSEQAVPALRKAFDGDRFSPRALRHTLWIFDAKELVDCVKLLRHADPGVRLEAVRALNAPNKRISLSKDLLLQLLAEDKDAQVRLAAAQVLQLSRDMTETILQLLATETDPFVRMAMVSAIRRDTRVLQGLHKLPQLLKAERCREAVFFALAQEDYQGGTMYLLAELAAGQDAAVRRQAIETLSRLALDRKPYAGTWWGTRPEQQKPPLRNIAWPGTPIARTALLTALGDKDDAVRSAAVAGLLHLNDPTTLEPLRQQFTKETGGSARADIVRAVAGLKSAAALDFLGNLALQTGQPEAIGVEAIAGLEQLRSAPALDRLAKVFEESRSTALVVKAVEALGSFKSSKQAVALCETALSSKLSQVRLTAVTALARLGDPAAVQALLPRLEDNDAAVRLATVRALGELKSPTAVPALIKVAAKADLQFDAITALSKTPDVRALTLYLTGLQSKNATLRQECRQAINAIRDEAAPLLEQLSQRHEIPSDVLPELRTVFTAYAPVVSWKLIGPFPNDDKAYPPEQEQNFKATYKGADGQVQWAHRKADARTGKVNLLALYTPNTDVVAYGYAELQSDAARDAVLLIGSDDSIVIWLNGQKVHEFPGERAWVADADKIKVHLQKGKNKLLIKCGQKGGDWAFSVALSGDAGNYAFLKDAGKKLDLSAFRAFARKTAGDAERGQKLFMDLKGLACVKCHAIAGQGGKVGPDLAGIALRYKKEDLMTSILEPSKVIAQGYETHVITTTTGNVVSGVLRGDDGESVTILDADGKEHKLAKKDIDDRHVSPVSTMPNGLADGMTLQDFADLIAFLEARKEELEAPR
jgi:putative heme-binding domain-containing protein